MRQPPIPEIDICLDFLHHMAINTKGKVSVCVRFDSERTGVIGDAKEKSLAEIWCGEKRMSWLEYHKQGKRDVYHYAPIASSGESPQVQILNNSNSVLNYMCELSTRDLFAGMK